MTDKPWSKEPTPIADGARVPHGGIEVIDADTARDLEQELRYARKLLLHMVSRYEIAMKTIRETGDYSVFGFQNKLFKAGHRGYWRTDIDAYLKATDGEG